MSEPGLSGKGVRREEELRVRLDELQRQLETEKSQRKQLHSEKVRDQRALREEMQSASREQMEKLRLKLQREKTSELQSLRDSMTKDFIAKMKEVQRRNEEQTLAQQKEWKKEKQDMRERLKRDAMNEVEKEQNSKFEIMRKKMATELFQMEKQYKECQEKLANALAADKTKGDRIREMKQEHQKAIESFQRSSRQSSRQQTEELEDMRRKCQHKEKEMAAVSERLSRIQADKEHLEDEIARMRKAEAWMRADPHTSPQTMSPPGTPGDITPTKQTYSKRERDMVIKNSELTFLNKKLEDEKSAADQRAKQLQTELTKAHDALKPKEEQIQKQAQRINNLNTALRSTEKRLKQTTEENVTLKSSKQQLEEEYSRQRRSLKQQLSQGSVYRAEREKLLSKNMKLMQDLKRMEKCLEDSQQENIKLKGWLGASLPLSPSPSLPDDDQFSVFSEASVHEHLEQMEFDHEETKAKYEELKAEYKGLREHYKELREKHDQLKGKAREQQATYRQVQVSFELLKKEKVELEREVTLLRSSGRDSPYDVERQKILLEEAEERRKEAEHRVSELEEFIIEQDEVSKSVEGSLREERESLLGEKLSLLEENQELQEKLEHSIAGSTTASSVDLSQQDIELHQVAELNRQIEEMEDENKELSAKFLEATIKMEQLVRDLQEMTQQNAELNEEKEELTMKLTAAKNEVDHSPEELIVLTARVAELEDANVELSHRVQELNLVREDTQREAAIRAHKAWQVAFQLQDIVEEEGTSAQVQELAAQLVGLLGQGDDEPDEPADTLAPTDKLQNCLRESKKLKRENTRLTKVVAESCCRVEELQALVHELESRLREEELQHSSAQMEKEGKIAQLTAELSQLESRVTRTRRAISVGVNQQMSRQLGQRVRECLSKVQEEVDGTDQENLQRQLQLMESALTELLHTVFPGEFEGATPTHNLPTEEETLALDQNQPLMNHKPEVTSPPLPLPPLPVKADTVPATAAQQGRTRLFLVIMDHDPHSLCTTGSPEKELTLPTGAVIAVHGEMNDGYYTATFEGVCGRVPANFVQELEVQDSSTQQRLINQTLSRPPLPPPPLTPSSTTSPLPTTPGLATPSPPSSFHIERALGHSVLLVSWTPPPLDSLNCSNGCHVAGYKLYVNEELRSTVSGATQQKALLAGLTVSQQPLNLAICTVTSDGRASKLISTDYTGPSLKAPPSPEPDKHRMYVALYDYDPVECSPNDNPEFELGFQEGTLIKVLGRELMDGFLVAEIGGRKGLVPASFVSEVEADDSRSQPESETVLPVTSKRMIARYDYTPSEHSPNDNPDMELSFKAGDLITIYGNMGEDGFYSGELEGKFGLVPSNFLEEVDTAITSEAASPSPPPTVTPPPSQQHISHSQSPGGKSSPQSSPGKPHPSLAHSLTDSSPSKRPPQLKGQKRGLTLSGSKDWVKNTFSRRRTGSAFV